MPRIAYLRTKRGRGGEATGADATPPGGTPRSILRVGNTDVDVNYGRLRPGEYDVVVHLRLGKTGGAGEELLLELVLPDSSRAPVCVVTAPAPPQDCEELTWDGVVEQEGQRATFCYVCYKRIVSAPGEKKEREKIWKFREVDFRIDLCAHPEVAEHVARAHADRLRGVAKAAEDEVCRRVIIARRVREKAKVWEDEAAADVENDGYGAVHAAALADMAAKSEAYVEEAIELHVTALGRMNAASAAYGDVPVPECTDWDVLADGSTARLRDSADNDAEELISKRLAAERIIREPFSVDEL